MDNMKSIILTVLSVLLIFSCVGFADNYNESPVLKKLVAEGELPPVEKRLPVEPKVEAPLNKIGKYGGAVQRFIFGEADFLAFQKFNSNPIVRWARNPGNGIEPNMAKDWEISADGTEITLYLRKGVKWSDGEPFTVDDVVFFFEDMLTDSEYQGAIGESIPSNWKNVKIEKLDDYSFKLVFPTPTTTILSDLAKRDFFWAPKHYLKDSHPKYNKNATYDDLYDKNNEAMYPERPTLLPWDIVEWKSGSYLIAERNPYFWKVDPEGNQLPYIDKVRMLVVQDSEVATLKIINGEIDIQARYIKFNNYTLLKENEEKGNYNVRLLTNGNNGPQIYFNMDIPEERPVIRELIRNRDFRIALSQGINREEINQVLYLGLAKPSIPTQLPGTAYYPGDDAVNQYRHQYQYNPENAKNTLDKLGLHDTDGDGIREKNGKPVEITIETPSSFSQMIDMLELIKEQWKDIGIKMNVKAIERSLLYSHMGLGFQEQTLYDAFVWSSLDGSSDLFAKVQAWADVSHGAYNGVAYDWYYSDGKTKRPELDWAVERIELYKKAISELDYERRKELAQKLSLLNTREVPMISTVSTPILMIVNNDLKNVPGNYELTWATSYRDIGLARPEQFYFDR